MIPRGSAEHSGCSGSVVPGIVSGCSRRIIHPSRSRPARNNAQRFAVFVVYLTSPALPLLLPVHAAVLLLSLHTVWGMFDLAKLYGFWTDPVDCFGRYFGYKGKQGADLLVKGLKRATSLDTYKPKKAKNKKSKSFNGSSSSSRTNGTAGSGLLRAVSAPAAVNSSRQGSSGGSSGGGKAADAGGQQWRKKLQAGAAAGAGGSSCLAERNSGSGLSGEVLIGSAVNQPAAPSAEDSSSESAASTGSASPGGARSSDDGVAHLASSRTNRDSSHGCGTTRLRRNGL